MSDQPAQIAEDEDHHDCDYCAYQRISAGQQANELYNESNDPTTNYGAW